MVKVSVIVPVYNASKYLNKCLDSLVNQTLKDIEIIVIDDGSTDESGLIIETYKKVYKKLFHVISRPNKGISASRNEGLKASRGEYIAFLDSDDAFHLDMLNLCYKYAKENDLDMVVTDYYKTYEDGTSILEDIIKFDITDIEKNPELIFSINASPWNKLYRKSLFDDITFPNIKYEDFAIMPLLLASSPRIGKINKALHYYLIRNNSETGIVDERVFDILKILSDHVEYFRKIGFLKRRYEEVEYLVVEKLVIYIIQERMQRDRKIANRFIDEAYDYLNTVFPNWRENKYYNKRNKLKLLIEKSSFLAKSYCSIYRLFRGDRYGKTR